LNLLTLKTKALRSFETSTLLKIPDGLKLYGEINCVKTQRSGWAVGGGNGFACEIEQT
jgi:hypothetical protein